MWCCPPGICYFACCVPREKLSLIDTYNPGCAEQLRQCNAAVARCELSLIDHTTHPVATSSARDCVHQAAAVPRHFPQIFVQICSACATMLQKVQQKKAKNQIAPPSCICHAQATVRPTVVMHTAMCNCSMSTCKPHMLSSASASAAADAAAPAHCAAGGCPWVLLVLWQQRAVAQGA